MFKATFFTVALVALAGCSGSNNSGDSRVPGAVAASSDLSALRDFTGVAATGPDNVVVTVGPAFKVVAQGDAKVLERIEIGVKDGTLHIGRKRNGGNFWGGMSNDKGATIRVSMPAIASAALTGSGNMQIDRADGQTLDLSVTGSGDLNMVAAKVATLKADVTGSGNMRLAGTADQTSFSATGSGDIDAGALDAGAGDISIMGSGDVRLKSDGAINVDIMGSGNAEVSGKAKCKVSVMGSGEARCAG